MNEQKEGNILGKEEEEKMKVSESQRRRSNHKTRKFSEEVSACLYLPGLNSLISNRYVGLFVVRDVVCDETVTNLLPNTRNLRPETNIALLMS